MPDGVITTVSPQSPAATRATAARLPFWVHTASLLVGAGILLYLGRGQWFYFDEWEFMWQPEALRRLVEGHNGHWSSIPIALWMGIQNTIGLGSYLPFLAVAVAAHLTVAHLLWRLMLQTGSDPWIATLIAATFVGFGTATENLMWAFQFAYMGAIAFALGALLIALRPNLGSRGLLAIGVLLVAGAATSGTSLPLFAALALVCLKGHGWRKALLAVGPPALVYLVWYFAFAGYNPTVIYQAKGIGETLFNLPKFVAVMFVDGYTSVTPVPMFGIVVVTAIAVWAVITVSRPLKVNDVALLGLVLSSLLFAGLTAFSRLQLGTDAGLAPRYIYMMTATTLPVVAFLLTWFMRGSRRRLAAIGALIFVVLTFNVGALTVAGPAEEARERNTHELVSAALDLAAAHPGDVAMGSYPDPVYVPRTLSELAELQRSFGLETIPYSDATRVTALTSVGLQVESASTGSSTCTDPITAGDSVEVDEVGVSLSSEDGADVVVVGHQADASGAERHLRIEPGTSVLTSPEPITLEIQSASDTLVGCQ